MEKLPILIVGAGPTGLSMAAELTKFNIPFRIIDKGTRTSSNSNALSIQPLTLELWDDLGLIHEATPLGTHIEGVCFYSGKKKLGEITTRNLQTLYPYMLGLSQHDSEMLLENLLQRKGIKVELETELINLSQTSDHVNAIIKTKSGHEEALQVEWLIACDGAHSSVRNLTRAAFTGKDLHEYFIIADAEVVSTLSNNKIYAFFNPHGSCFLIPFNKKFTRMVFEVSKIPALQNEQGPTPEILKQLLKERCPVSMRIKNIVWTSGFSIRERLINAYRNNRIFFAGDAAHLYSPTASQGMNLGMQDVYNLTWKLAGVINKEIQEKILDTYQQERRPVAKSLSKRVAIITKIGVLNNKVARFLRNLFLPILLKHKASQKFIAINTQLATAYWSSNLTKECIKPSQRPCAGDHLIDCWLDAEKTSHFFDYVRGGKACIMFFSGILRGSNLQQLLDIKKNVAERYGDLFHYLIATVTENQSISDMTIINDIDQKLHRTYQVTLPTIYFIRPDKYIGFRGRLEDQDELLNYLKNIYC